MFSAKRRESMRLPGFTKSVKHGPSCSGLPQKAV
jgi:hypothetical protein